METRTYCPICNRVVAPFAPEVTVKGNTKYHNSCIRKQLKETEQEVVQLELVWSGAMPLTKFTD